nr:reverse transcriptase domain-containing protein [Tanacetum cinerariifolium]
CTVDLPGDDGEMGGKVGCGALCGLLGFRRMGRFGPWCFRSCQPVLVLKALKAEMAEINKNLMRVLQVNKQLKAVTPNCETCGGPHSFSDCPAIVGNTQNVYAAGAYQCFNQNQNRNNQNHNFQNQNRNQGNHHPQRNNQGRNQFLQGDKQGQNQPPAYQVPAYQAPGSGTLLGPTIPTTSFSPVVERETEVTKDTVHHTNNRSTEDVQPPVVQSESPTLNSEPVVSLIIEHVASPVSALRPNQKPLIPYPSRLLAQKLRTKANDQREKFFQIFNDLNFNINFVDVLILMQNFCPSIKILLTNKDNLYELARTPLNKHCSTVLLKNLPEKLGDPDKFLISCDFHGMAECLALADLDASINLMPLSMWNKLSLPNLSPTCMTLELVDRLISHPVVVAEDVFVKV